MDYIKDEAIKAKGIAEKKMQSKDFNEAKKFALKAQRLCSGLDGISQMLTVIDVHCSAAQKVMGTEMDWYGILQVDLTADDSLVKKQYRKLALLLHPDKNKLAGAEAAFKIIGDAHRVLSDWESRAKYDTRYKTFKERSTHLKQWQDSNVPFQKQPGAGNVFGNINRTQGERVSHPQNQPGFPKPTFWTICPFCSTKYQYYKDILNKPLRCQNCSKPFYAYDLNAQGPPSGANWTWQAATQAQKVTQDGRNIGPQNTGSALFPNKGYQGNCNHATAASSVKKPGTSNSSSEPKDKSGVCENVKEAAQGESQNIPKHNVGKPSKKAEVDAREKYDAESSNSVEELDTPEKQKYFGISELYDRTSAQKRRVTYNEDRDIKHESAGPNKDKKSSTVVEDQTDGGALKNTYCGNSEGNDRNSAQKQKRRGTCNEDKDVENEFAGPHRDTRSSSVIEDQTSGGKLKTKKLDDIAAGVVNINLWKKQRTNDPFEENFCNRNANAEPSEKKGKSSAAGEDSNEKCKSDDICGSSSRGDETVPEPVSMDVADTEFYSFDNDKREDSFLKDQLWAIYDYVDSMPRFYAWIKKVYPPGFKVRITWLEPDPDDQDEIDWVDGDLPVSCGKFKFQKTETTEDINMFSHVVPNTKVVQRGVFFISPAKGETWAIFKKWNISWNSDADNHREYEFDYVEILSDYDQESGIIVAYLEKVKGFVSLFKRKKEGGLSKIPGNELYRFSHMVPCYQTTGKERKGVPEGSFELDPAALPTNSVDPFDV